MESIEKNIDRTIAEVNVFWWHL